MKLLRSLRCFAAAVVLAVSAVQFAQAEEFAKPTIDLGMIVGDVDKSAKFYTEAIGFKELPGFTGPGAFLGDIGLTDNKTLVVRVFALGDGPDATKLKIIGGDKTSRPSDTKFVDSQLGFRYLTLYVADMKSAMARLEKAGVKPISKGAVPLPKGFPEGVYLTTVRDPDGNMVELVGPMKP